MIFILFYNFIIKFILNFMLCLNFFYSIFNIDKFIIFLYFIIFSYILYNIFQGTPFLVAEETPTHLIIGIKAVGDSTEIFNRLNSISSDIKFRKDHLTSLQNFPFIDPAH